MKLNAPRRAPLRLSAAALTLAVAGAAQAQDEAPAYSVIAPLATGELLLDASQVDGLTAAVGTRGIVLLSEDGGDSWRQVSVPTRSMLTGVHFHDRQRGWAVGHDTVILRTVDGGETWERTYFDPERQTPLFDVWFADADNGIAVGAYGLFLRTADGGASWVDEPMEIVKEEEQVVVVEEDADGDEAAAEVLDEFEEDFEGPADFHLNRVSRARDGTLYIAAEAGNVFRSDDDGATWVSLDTGYDGSFFSVLPYGEESLIAAGLQGSLFRSDDAGISFRRIDSPVETLLNEGTVLDDGRLVIVGMSGTILVSDDGGDNFYVVQREDRKALTQVLEIGDDAVVLFGEAGPVKLPLGVLNRP